MLTPNAYRAIATIVRAARMGALSAARMLTADPSPADAAHHRGYAQGWDACATLVQLTAADVGAHDALGDVALMQSRLSARDGWDDGIGPVGDRANP